jgi:hypothetical protein
MNIPVVVTVAVAVVVIIALVAWSLARRRRSQRLRERFGPEYERTVRESGSPARAEETLESRERRVAHYHIRPLGHEESGRFAETWRVIQARFVDDPSGAVVDADRVIAEVMQTKGYPMNDFAARAADLSVDHGAVVDHYRTAHGIVGRHERGDASTEDLRQAMRHYRALFDDLIEVEEPKSARRQ